MRSPGRGGGPNWRAAALLALSALAFASVAAFLVAAAVRRLNFDESLALRAGFLSLSGIPAEPGFAMPFTVLLGLLGLGVADPGLVFLLARVLVAGAVLLSVAVAVRSVDGAPGIVAGTLVATLASAAFFVHGLEFRYDAAILVLLMISLPLLVRGNAAALVALGAVAGLLATHHLKGAYFGVVVVGLAALRGGVRGLPRVFAGLAGTIGAWVLLAHATGVLPDVVGLFSSFFDVAIDTQRRNPWLTLTGALRRDGAWWGGGVGMAAWTLVSLAGRSREELRNSADAWSLALAGAAVSFLFVHPHPFAYMLALPAPFLGFLSARRLAAARPGPRGIAFIAIACLLVAQAVARPRPFVSHVASFTAPRDTQVEALRWLKARSTPDDRIVDPSGMAYFLAPCTSQWYMDSLFQGRAQAGAWMAAIDQTDLAACPWLILTNRLNMLPAHVQLRLAKAYRPAQDGIALYASDPRWAGPGMARRGGVAGLESFW